MDMVFPIFQGTGELNSEEIVDLNDLIQDQDETKDLNYQQVATISALVLCLVAVVLLFCMYLYDACKPSPYPTFDERNRRARNFQNVYQSQAEVPQPPPDYNALFVHVINVPPPTYNEVCEIHSKT